MAYINEDEINKIRSEADIVDIIASYIKVTMKGKNHVALCPFHDDHNPSMVISRDKQIFSCFRCHTSGNVFSFVMQYENVSFPEAVNIVAKKIGYSLKNATSSNTWNKKYSKEYEIYEFAKKYYANNLMTNEGRLAREYLLKRGIDNDIIKEFNLGLASTNKDTFYKLCLNKKWNIDLINNLGLINKVDVNIYDTFINRIVIPIENLEGNTVGFTGRIFNGENTAKYLNTKETPIFTKGKVLFNYHNARKYIKENHYVVVVEGNMDAIKMSSKGFKNVVALMGVALSKEQINILKKLNVPVVLMLDNDDAGRDATLKDGDLLEANGIETKVVRLSGAKDPDEYLEKFGIESMQNNLKNPHKYLDFKLEYLKSNKDLSKMEDLVDYLKEVINSINDKDDLTKDVIVTKIANDYGVDKDILKSSLKVEVKEKRKVEEPKKINKLSKYTRASHKILYYMLMDNKYITIYKNRLGYFKDVNERILASEIIYQYSKGISDVADITTNVMNNSDIYPFLQIIISENSNTIIRDDEFDSLIDAVNKMYKQDKIKELNNKINNELDESIKLKLIEELVNLKKEV